MPAATTGDIALPNELLTYDDLVQIVELIKSTESYSEVHFKLGGIEIDLRKLDASSPAPHAAAAPARPAPADDAVSPAAAATQRPPSAGPAEAPARSPAQVAEGMAVIKSPMVGTFYRSPEPGAPPFVEVGERVAPDRTVCIIEVMKLMNSIPAGCAGRVAQVLVDDAEMVEMGQPLIVIDPKG